MKTGPGYDLVIRLLETTDVLVQESRRLFRPHGLTEAQFNVLNVLGPAEDGLSQRELSDILVVDRSNTTVMLATMERHGWVRRARHPRDRRVQVVTLTPAGRKIWQKVLPEYVAAVEQVTGALSRLDMAQLSEHLLRLTASARQWGEKYEG